MCFTMVVVGLKCHISYPRNLTFFYKLCVTKVAHCAWTDGQNMAMKISQKIEKVQRRAARYVKNRHRNTSSVLDMLGTMNWRSLQDRRRDARLCMIYKIDRNLVAIKKDKCLIPPQRRTRQSHARAYQTLSCRTDQRKNSFFPRTVRDWNALPPDTTEAESLAAFKARVTKQNYLSEPEGSF